MEWMLMPLKRYAEFSGRSRRMEYWMFVLFTVAIFVGLGIIASILGAGASSGSGEAVGGFAVILFGIIGLGLVVPSIAVQVRRFHDQGRSGWFFLLNFIPAIGGIIVLVFMFLPGTVGDNEYGPDPKAGEV